MADNDWTIESRGEMHSDTATDVHERAVRRNAIMMEMQKYQEMSINLAEMARNRASQFNDLLPIGRVPPEIMAKIFVAPSSLRRRRAVKSPNARERVGFTHVCRRWRAIALGSPTLWNTIDFHDNPHLISWMLSHSKQVPLTIDIKLACMSKALEDILTRILLDEMHRVVELKVRSVPEVLGIAPAPRLKNLQIFNMADANMNPFGGILNGSEAPALQSLHVHGPWPFTLIPTVCHPNLRSFNLVIRSDPQSLDNLFDLLDGMPLLECLSLSSPSGPDQPSQPTRSQTESRFVKLHHLRQLSLAMEKLEPGINLLSLLDIPAAERVKIKGHYWAEPMNSISRLESISKLQYLSIYLTTGDIILNLSDRIIEEIDIEDTGILGLSIETFTLGDWTDVGIMCRALPLSQVEVLLVEDLDSELGISYIFSLMPRLRILRLYQGVLDDVLFALVMFEDDGDSACSFPHFQLLVLINIELPAPGARYSIELLRDILVSRRQKPDHDQACHCKYDKIVYEHCPNLDAEMASLLREITGAVADNFGDEQESSDTGTGDSCDEDEDEDEDEDDDDDDDENDSAAD